MEHRNTSGASRSSTSRLAELLQWLAQRPPAEQTPTPSELAEVIWLARWLPVSSRRGPEKVDPIPADGPHRSIHSDDLTPEEDVVDHPIPPPPIPPQLEKGMVKERAGKGKKKLLKRLK